MPEVIISTIVLRLHRPSRRKQTLLRQCVDRYAEGIQLVLDRLRPEVDRLAAQGQRPSLTTLSRLMTSEDLRRLKPLGLEPLADGLRMDLAMLLLNYLSHTRNSQPASQPLIRRSPDDWQALANNMIAESTAGRLPRRQLRIRLERSLATVGRCKSVYFGRHAAARDFCLLYQPETGRFFAKIHLLNRQAARDWNSAATACVAAADADARQATGHAPLYHLTDGHPPLARAGPGDRFIVVPLDMGLKQYHQLTQAWQNPQMVRTARLCRKGDQFDLHVQVRQRLPEPRQTLHVLGLVRSGHGNGRLRALPSRRQRHPSGTFSTANPQTVADAVCRQARQTAAQVVMADLACRHDGLYRSDPHDISGEPFAAACSRAGWLTLARLLARQLPLSGLPQPALLSPHCLYQTCPACQNRRKANRLRDNLLVCTACGYSESVAQAGSRNMVHKFIHYQLQRQPPAESDRTVP